MNIYTCTDHDGHWVGVASVIVAEAEDQARALLAAELKSHGLDGSRPFTLRRINTGTPKAFRPSRWRLLMNNISTARGFERMQAEEAHEWPAELQAKGQRALIALKMMVGQEEQFAQSQALREAAAADLMDFAASHAAWKAKG